MMALVLGTIIVGSIPMFIYTRRANGHEPIPKHKRGGISIIAVCLILLLFLTQAFGGNAAEGTCKAGGKSRIHAGIEFDPLNEDCGYDDDDD